ncbi:MAG: ATP-binding protein [Mastigocoleus sp. MO_167.B18]|nr:ATP-binding protein [Mastigocoleus sp. MO_167.B18]
MTSPIDYSKIYTDAPELHPNLILGSLQLLFWLFFRPNAWRNYLKHVDPALDYNSRDRQSIQWRNHRLWKLVTQVYLVTPCVTILILLSALGLPVDKLTYDVAVVMAVGMAVVVVCSVAISMAVGMAVAVSVGVGVGISVAVGMVVGGTVHQAWFGVPGGLGIGMAYGLAVGVAEGVGMGVGVSVVAGMAYTVGINAAYGVAISVGATINLWRPVLIYPFLTLFHTLLYSFDQQFIDNKSSFLHWHSSFWDEYQLIPLIGLDKHLVQVMEQNTDEGVAAIEYLNNSRQRWAIQAAQTELDARKLERSTEIRSICKIHHNLIIEELEGKASPILFIFTRISKDVDNALNQRSNYNQRLALTATADRLNANLQDLTRSSNKYAPRFRPIAQKWHEIITNYVEELAKEVELRQEIDSPYILAVPLTQEQEIFSGRDDIGTRIEQLILDRRRPPLLLYGQRRMGKTSLLYNLGKLLPSSIIPMFVDLQGAPSSANNYTGFLYNLARGMINSAKKEAVNLPSLTRETLKDDPFTCFDEWLDRVEEVLEQNTALLMLDEFEVLDSAITKGRFDEQDVLGMLRHLIQHRRRFKVMLAGSHTIEEYQRWASYLINVQVVHISYLEEESARRLIERPVKDFMLRYEPDTVERVLELTRCHPFLVQLLCSEIVAYKNEQDLSVRRLATLDDVEAAATEALNSGSFFFADIQKNQVNAVGLDILRFMAARGEGAIVNKNTILQEISGASESDFQKLLQRELIEKVGYGYRFQVELIRRWFAR